MFYYAEINNEYLVINLHSLAQPSTIENYIVITEEQYTSGEPLGKYYNALMNTFEIMDFYNDFVCGTNGVTHKTTNMPLMTKLDNMQVIIDNKAEINHTHTEYALSEDLQVLEDTIDAKANADHSHTEYALVDHTHNNYATQVALDALGVEVDGKADTSHTHSEYASSTHLHNGYADVNHNHDSNYAPLSHSHTEYVTTDDFNTLETEVDGKANVNHIHDNYATVNDLDELSSIVSGKANTTHSHNDIYYTETEINDKLATKADSSHNHTGVYDINGAAASALSSAQTYTDEAIDALSETVAIKADASTLSSHTGNNAVHITSAERSKLSGIAEGANNYVLPSAGTSLGGVKSGGDVTISSGVITVNDDSHNHVISNVDGLQTALDSKAASGHNHDGVYYTETEVDTLLEGKANSSHTHTISNITNLQSTLDGKANASHGTHVSYSTTAPVMDGSASVGTASTVARSDHKHPTDTSRAAQTSLDSHTSNKSNPHGVTLTQLGVTSTASELNALDGITATVTELNFVDGVTSNIQTQLNSKAASSHTHSIANITNLQTTLDGKAASSHTHKVANISDLTATATELNYMDGVTSNVQTQLDGKAASSHNHSASNIASGTLSSDRLPTVPISKGGTGATTAAGALTNLGITATAAELNYVDGVTSNIQTQLNSKASSSHGTHVTYSTTVPKANGTASAGTASTVSRSDHVHPLQTTVSGNAGTATTISKRVKITSSQSANAGKYIKFGTITLSSGYSGFMGYLMFNPTETSAGANGLLHLHIRNGADTTTTSCTMKWLTLNESKYEKTVSAVKVSNGVFDLYYKPIGTWDTMEIIVVSGDNHGTLNLANSGTYVDSITATYTSSIGGQVNYANSAGNATSATTASACTGNSATATKLSSAKTISLTGDVTGSTSFDGSGNVSITATVADDSHNHTIANVDGLQSALDGKSATSHNHNSAYISKDLQPMADNGDVSISWSGKDVVAQFKALASGMYTVYSPAGCTNNPNSSESFRFMIHKTGSANYGWIMAYGAQGSVYTGYIDNGNWKGWKALFEAAPQPLWTGASYMTDVHTITPSKTLSQCRNGWLLLWSDYDPGSGANNTDFYASVINKRAYTGQVWNGGEWYCDVPSYSAGTATDSEQRVIKLLKIYDSKIVGTVNNSAAPRNDVVLRAVYEW